MQTLLQTLYDQHLSLLIDGFFWVDICALCAGVLLVYYYVVHRSYTIVKSNILTNTNLLKFRTEVYHFYEKNFFV